MNSATRIACLLMVSHLTASCSSGGTSSALTEYLWGDPSEPNKPAAAAPAPAGPVPRPPSAQPVPQQQTAVRAATAPVPSRTTPTVKSKKGSQRVIAIVNDEPITDFDITQRVNMTDALGIAQGSAQSQRKEAERELIDDVIRRTEAKRYQITVSEKQVNSAINNMARSLNTDAAGLEKRLKARGVSMAAFRKQVEAKMMFRQILQIQHNVQIDVTEKEIDRKLAQVDSDPRLKPVLVYELQEISLPVEEFGGGSASQLMQARAVEAQTIIARFKSCRTTRTAAQGIYNVKIGKVAQAPADRLPPEMKNVLDKAGPGKVVGPMRAQSGIRLVAFCGKRSIKPPAPTRDMVKNLLLNEKYKQASDRVMRNLRRRAYIDYKNQG